MDLAQTLIVAIALATYKLWQLAITGYYMLPTIFFRERDIFGRRHYRRLNKIKKRFLSTWTIPVVLTAVSLTLTPWWNWETVDPHFLIRPAILAASGIMTWRAITMDVELATGTSYPLQRALVVLTWIGVWFHPGFLILLLHTGITWLRSNYHHQHLSIRVMIILLAYLGALPLLALVTDAMDLRFDPDLSVPALFLFLCVTTSTYFLGAMKKISLGPHWYSWVLNIRLHSLPMSAYLWRWLRFLPRVSLSVSYNLSGHSTGLFRRSRSASNSARYSYCSTFRSV